MVSSSSLMCLVGRENYQDVFFLSFSRPTALPVENYLKTVRFLFVFSNYARRFLIVLSARFLFVLWPHSHVTAPLVGCPWTPERVVCLSLATWRLGLERGKFCLALPGPFGATLRAPRARPHCPCGGGPTRATIPTRTSPSMADHLHVGGGREYIRVDGN